MNRRVVLLIIDEALISFYTSILRAPALFLRLNGIKPRLFKYEQRKYTPESIIGD